MKSKKIILVALVVFLPSLVHGLGDAVEGEKLVDTSSAESKNDDMKKKNAIADESTSSDLDLTDKEQEQVDDVESKIANNPITKVLQNISSDEPLPQQETQSWFSRILESLRKIFSWPEKKVKNVAQEIAQNVLPKSRQEEIVNIVDVVVDEEKAAVDAKREDQGGNSLTLKPVEQIAVEPVEVGSKESVSAEAETVEAETPVVAQPSRPKNPFDNGNNPFVGMNLLRKTVTVDKSAPVIEKPKEDVSDKQDETTLSLVVEKPVEVGSKEPVPTEVKNVEAEKPVAAPQSRPNPFAKGGVDLSKLKKAVTVDKSAPFIEKPQEPVTVESKPGEVGQKKPMTLAAQVAAKRDSLKTVNTAPTLSDEALKKSQAEAAARKAQTSKWAPVKTNVVSKSTDKVSSVKPVGEVQPKEPLTDAEKLEQQPEVPQSAAVVQEPVGVASKEEVPADGDTTSSINSNSPSPEVKATDAEVSPSDNAKIPSARQMNPMEERLAEFARIKARKEAAKEAYEKLTPEEKSKLEEKKKAREAALEAKLAEEAARLASGGVKRNFALTPEQRAANKAAKEAEKAAKEAEKAAKEKQRADLQAKNKARWDAKTKDEDALLAKAVAEREQAIADKLNGAKTDSQVSDTPVAPVASRPKLSLGFAPKNYDAQ